jgi:hypothetical protein
LGEGQAGLQDGAQGGAQRRGAFFEERRWPVGGRGLCGGLVDVAAAGELDLDGVDARLRLAIATGRPAALEAAIGYAAERAGVAGGLDRGGERRIAARAAVGSDVDVRQLAVEQPRTRERIECAS